MRILAAALLLACGAAAAAESAPPLPDLHWRLLGPFRAGWATVAAGIPDRPEVYFIGTAGGGVWKTANAGRTWSPISDGAGIVSVGALAIAPGDPQTIYVGSGQPEPRYDIAAGDGMFKSTDGGKSWQRIGLGETRHIGKIWVDPRDPNVVVVAALGHIFGPDRNRGVYRSEDGGKTWRQALYIDEQTGVVDLAADPAHPRTLYAAAWEARNWPWLSYFTPIVGEKSGLYKSGDGGKTWQPLRGEGWPQGKLGRIGLAAAKLKRGTRLYAAVDAEKDGGLWRSDDAGSHWQRVNDAEFLSSWYFARLLVDPRDPDIVYAMGQSIRRSTDAGKSFTEIRGAPGGDDYHDLWINPEHPQYWITGSDQGAVVSVDDGKTWSSWYNQPTGQFYHLAADDRFPYWIYSAQQDSGTVALASRGDYGALSFRDWHPVGGDERDYDIPDPQDPNLVYGSGLGGRISRWDARTGQVANVSPWPLREYGKRPTAVKYRYTWITPIAVSSQAPWSLYVGNQQLFRSRDRGEHWQAISGDLTGKRADARNCEGDVAIADARACSYGVIYTIAPSPRRNDEIWIGTDDGLVQLTRDGGKHWSEVTPKDLPKWARVDSIDVSALDAGTAYVVADNHRQDDFRPYAWRTRDYGKSWQRIDAGLPAGQFTTVLRADPGKLGLLYAGTDHGVFVSFDDGAHWQPLQLNLPAAWVRDLLVHGDDLIVATQGRAIWVLDDVTPLRQMSDEIARSPAHLFAPAAALRVRPNNNHDTPLPPETPLAPNPPAGAVIDYWLGADASGPVKLRILDANGKLVREFSSEDRPRQPHAERYFMQEWLKPAATPSAAPGMHRFVWDLCYPQPRALSYEYSIAAIFGTNTPTLPQGPYALPGRYTVELAAGGKTLRVPLEVKLDPRVKVKAAALQSSLEFSRHAGEALEQAFVAGGQLDAVRKQLEALKPRLAHDAALNQAAEDFLKHSEPLGKKKEGRETDFATISAALGALETDVEAIDAAPTAAQESALKHYTELLRKSLADWTALRDGELAPLRAKLSADGYGELKLPSVDEIDAGPSASKDLP